MNKKQKKNLIRIIISGIMLLTLEILEIENKYLSFVLYMVPYFIVGYDILKKALKIAGITAQIAPAKIQAANIIRKKKNLTAPLVKSIEEPK